MNKSTQAGSGVCNPGRQHGNSARVPRQPNPPTAKAAPRAARPATHPRTCGDAGRTLFLTPTERSFGGEIRPLAGRAGTDEALAAARAGDVERLDRHELAWLNAWGPRPTVEQLTGEADDSLDVVAESLIRASGGPIIEWHVVKVDCWLCFRRTGGRHPRCRSKYCDGTGYDAFGDAWTYYTDPDLNLVHSDA